MINELYKKGNVILEIKNSLEKNKVIKLEEFLTEKIKNSGKLKFKKEKIADRFSYEEAKNKELEKIFLSKEIKEFLKKITKKGIKNIRVLRFGHKNYRILHDEKNPQKEEKFYFFVCKKWKHESGGNIAFKKEDGKVFYLTPTHNSLSIVKKEKNWEEFLQYINHLAGKEKFILIEGKLS